MKLRRDRTSNALINIDEEGYKRARLRKQLQRKNTRTEHQQQSLEIRVVELEKRLEKLERKLQAETVKTEIEKE